MWNATHSASALLQGSSCLSKCHLHSRQSSRIFFKMLGGWTQKSYMPECCCRSKTRTIYEFRSRRKAFLLFLKIILFSLQFWVCVQMYEQMSQTLIDIVEGWHYLLAQHLSNLAAVGSWRKRLWDMDQGRCIFNYHWYRNREKRGMEERSCRGGGGGGGSEGSREREKTRVHFLIKAP